MKGVGEPGAGEPHARFDGGELEKELATAADHGGPWEPRDLSPVSPTAATSPAPYPTNLRLDFGANGSLAPFVVRQVHLLPLQRQLAAAFVQTLSRSVLNAD